MKLPTTDPAAARVPLPSTPLATTPGIPMTPTAEPASVPGSEADGRRQLERTGGSR